MIDFGIVKPGSTLDIAFASYGKTNGESITMTGLAVGDIKIFKNGSVTERSSTTGFTLLDTDGIDIDAITGIHGFSIDLSSNADAGFYAAGARYSVVVSTITVDSQTISFVAATFRIGHEQAILNTTIATLASQTSFTLTSGPAEDDALNGMWLVIHDVASAVQQAVGLILDYTGSTKTVTLVAGPTFTVAASDNVSVMGPWPLQAATFGRTLVVDSSGVADANLAKVLGTAPTEGAGGRLAGGVTKFFNVASPTGTVNSIPDAIAGATNGLFIAGTNAATTITTALTTTFTGSLTGSVASVTAGVTLAASAVQAIWDALTSALTTSGSIGKYIIDNVTTLLARLTSARAGYLDNLNIGGNVAGSAEVTGLVVNTRANLTMPVEIETPDSGTQIYKVRLSLYDEQGNMEAPDSTPTVTLANAAGTDRSSRLSSASNPSTGGYTWDYTATAGDAEEQLVWVFTVVEGGLTRTYAATNYVVEESAYRFTSTDRSNLGAIKNKTDNLPTDPADASDIAAAFGTVNGTLATIAGYLDTEITLILARLGAITGSGVNTVLGIFKALLSKTASIPSDIGGTFDPATDSTEALRDRGDAAWVTGGGGGTDVQDLLEADRYIDKTGTPWKLVLIRAGTGDLDTGAVLLEQELFNVDGVALSSTDTVVGRSVAP